MPEDRCIALPRWALDELGLDELPLGDEPQEEARGGERAPVGKPLLREPPEDAALGVEDPRVRVPEGSWLARRLRRLA